MKEVITQHKILIFGCSRPESSQQRRANRYSCPRARQECTTTKERAPQEKTPPNPDTATNRR